MKIQFGDKVKVKSDSKIYVVVKIVQDESLYYLVPEDADIERFDSGDIIEHGVYEEEDIIPLEKEERKEEKKMKEKQSE